MTPEEVSAMPDAEINAGLALKNKWRLFLWTVTTKGRPRLIEWVAPGKRPGAALIAMEPTEITDPRGVDFSISAGNDFPPNCCKSIDPSVAICEERGMLVSLNRFLFQDDEDEEWLHEWDASVQPPGEPKDCFPDTGLAIWCEGTMPHTRSKIAARALAEALFMALWKEKRDG